MNDDIKNSTIENSLLFFVIRDALPICTANGLEYTCDDLSRDGEILVAELRRRLDSINRGVAEIISDKASREQEFLNHLLLRPLNEKMHRVVKETYHEYYRPAVGAKQRDEILARDGYRCQYCGADLQKLESQGFPAHVDHINPRRAGGSHHPKNLVASCLKCNLGKKDYEIFKYENDAVADEPEAV